MTIAPMYPDLIIPVNNGSVGNPLMILATLKRELRSRNMDSNKIEKIFTEALSSDYDHVLHTVGKYATLQYS